MSVPSSTILALSALVVQPAHAAFVSYEGFSYCGSISVFDTLFDAQAGIDARSGPHVIPTGVNGSLEPLTKARDAHIFADTDSGTLLFGTLWAYPLEPEKGRGWGNPNNSNTDFVQLYDIGGSSVDSSSINFDATGTLFSVASSGGDARATAFARLWHAPGLGGAASLTGGAFLAYDLAFNANFGTPAVEDFIEGEPGDVSGYFRGLFQNTKTTDIDFQGFYAFNFVFGTDSWARNEDAEVQDYGPYSEVAFRSFSAPLTSANPLPASAPLLMARLAEARMEAVGGATWPG